ncbi:MAG: dihydroorotase [Porphyromonas sp.]|nr:dihydroorotase [Porphyromonas sp.]
MESTLIKGATVVNEGRKLDGASVLIEGAYIAKVYSAGDPLPDADRVIDAEGLLCLPGVIDDQVHFREPGLTHKGDIASESRAAVLGGVTSFMEMPNTLPQTTTLEAWQDKMDRGAASAFANYSFYFGATNDNTELLSDLDLKHTPGVKVFMGASTGNMLVDKEAALRAIFAHAPLLIATHCESEEVIQRNKARVVAEVGEDPDVRWHPVIRDRVACYESSARAVRLAREYGAKLHVLHLSTAEELELLDEARHITGEVCVHHLWFTDKDYEREGTRIKWNPAVKELRDREALREAVRTGKLNVIATDHAPHLLSEKEGGALSAASGGPLVQHSLLMMLELVRQGVFTLERVVECMCHNPAELFEVERRGYIREGYFADIVLVDPRQSWVVGQENIASKCGWSPLEGTMFNHTVVSTFVNGREVVRGAKIVDDALGAAMPLTFNHKRWR